MSQLHGAAVDDLQNFVCHHAGLCRISQGRSKQVGIPSLLWVHFLTGQFLHSSRHRRVDDSWLDNGDSHIERNHLLGECLADRFQRKLRRRVTTHRRIGDPSSNRGDVDDAPTRALPHIGNNRLDAAQRPKVVRLHHRPHLGQR